MQTIESIPVFRTQAPLAAGALAKEPAQSFALEFEPEPPVDDTPPPPLGPMWYKTSKPALPVELWLDGLSIADALGAHSRLKIDYFCTVGKSDTGYSVRCDPANYRLIP